MAGALGDISAFSFYPTKNLGAYGDGGLCYGNDSELMGLVRSIRFHGFEGRYFAEREGMNSRLDELQAAILSVKLEHFQGHLARRRELAARYDETLSPSIGRTPAPGGVAHAYHLFVVKLQDRDDVRAALAERGIHSGIHYPAPIHLMKGYAFLGQGPGSLPVTERLAGEILSLPLYPELPPESVDVVVSALNELSG